MPNEAKKRNEEAKVVTLEQLVKRPSAIEKPKDIVGFVGKHYWLSWESESPVERNGQTYPSVLHAFAASGVKGPGDMANRIRQAASGSEVRRLFKDAWKNYAKEQERIDILAELLMAKFTDPELRQKLKATGKSRLVYTNNHGDVFWGVCGNNGFNAYGRTLMAIRERINELDAQTYSHGSDV